MTVYQSRRGAAAGAERDRNQTVEREAVSLADPEK
jgi:hypothetical protein